MNFYLSARHGGAGAQNLFFLSLFFLSASRLFLSVGAAGLRIGNLMYFAIAAIGVLLGARLER
ncbi:hypothetical protein KB879_19235 [Cupriavidus sp. KK10]|jgi:hypothetical protein|uniref:hypothetical protein n=1 Tax=Cupriavidus sp. KK10 TaxID=1478019 RepID=UPI001BA47EF9|nr:hypothetical protein [Cupriavidus sp. KK10]QUN26296.1 hypothetical protein KB879_19235 [Cupriavidus sp. KK10]